MPAFDAISSSVSQKAPSAKRCIKTIQGSVPLHINNRQSESTEHQKVHYVILLNPLEAVLLLVRKHRAPKGALRPRSNERNQCALTLGQKSPSAKRCTKTLPCRVVRDPVYLKSEITERQKVH